ncbi:lambda A [Reptilian orthoreovirus]|uniref:Lambda A n=1 Tax=chelonian orthoreovirus TaxID=3071237 RepID=A0A1D7PVG8_9REOV|nr:lambda A [Reptilian orthoreovirus]AOM63684.1 lambda A [chelonian orthoreovirus]
MPGYGDRVRAKKLIEKKTKEKTLQDNDPSASSLTISDSIKPNVEGNRLNPQTSTTGTDGSKPAEVAKVAAAVDKVPTKFKDVQRHAPIAANNPNASSNIQDEQRANAINQKDTPDSTISYVPEGALGLNELERSFKVDHSGGVKPAPIKQEAKDAAASTMTPRPVVSGIPVVERPNGYTCNVCMQTFSTLNQLTVHQLSHGLGPSAGLASYDISKAAVEFVESWSNATATANLKDGLSIEQIDNLMMVVPPRLITWDAGIASSFKLEEIVPASTVQDVVLYTWFSSAYDISTPFPQASVVRIILHTNWAAILDHSRKLEVKLLPPLNSNVDAFTHLLSLGLTPDGAYNPRVLRVNVLLMAIKFVLDNLHLNKNTAYVLDLTAAMDPVLGSKQLRQVASNDAARWYPIMYPSRVKLPNRSKTADFINGCVPDRIGRVHRAQEFSGAMAEWADTYETCDSLTLAIREAWRQRLERMNVSPQQIAHALSRCAKHYITVAAPQAPSITRLMPWRVSSDERRLLQLMLFMNISTNADYFAPLLNEAARTLRAISPLHINPRLIADAISSVVEQTTNTISPAAAILTRLRPAMSDFSDFSKACIAFMYNGVATTYLDDNSYPRNNGNVLDVETLVDMFVALVAMPMVTDPNGPCKAFMILANAMYGFENIAMDDPNWNQKQAASSFNSPSLWPKCFTQLTIDRVKCPHLAKWAETIHRLWPQPSQITYGAADIIGSANLFTDPDVLLLPFQTSEPNTASPTLSLTNEMCNWRNAVVELIVSIVQDGRFSQSWNPAMRASMVNAMTKFKIIRSYTPAYIAELLPTELAAIAPILPFQPLQVPFVAMNVAQIPTKFNISRQAPYDVSQPALNITMTNELVGVPIAVNARPITVALLSGTYQEDPPLITNVWYAQKLTPLYTHDGLFSNLQHAMVVSEAYRTALYAIAQCAEINYPVTHPFDWIPQIELPADASANLAKKVNEAFMQAFDMSDDTVLLQPFLTGDPRASQLTVSYERFNGTKTDEIITPGPSMIAEAVSLVGETIRHEYNIFGLCRGDIIIGQQMYEAGMNPLQPPAALVFDEGDPDVRTFSANNIATITYGLNSGPMTIEDSTGANIPLEGKWVMPLSLWQMNCAFFKTVFPQRIRLGHLYIRIKMEAYPYIIQYYDSRVAFDGFGMFEKWMDALSATGTAPVPFLMPESKDHNVSSGLTSQYIIATEYNDAALFCTNSSSPATVFGPSKSVPTERYSVLTDETVPPRANQLPEKIDFYGLVRRYNLETPKLTGVVTTYGNGLPRRV